MDRRSSQRVLRHRKILVNRYEQTADAQLNDVAERNSARVFPKVRLADVLAIDGSGVSAREYRYALQAHFDFVVAETDGTPYFAVEFDGHQHVTDRATIERDRLKDGLCQRFGLPLLRVDADYLRTSGRFTLLGWLVDLWFLYQAFCEAQDNGSVPDDEPFFIPSFIELAPGGGVRPIFDLGHQALLLLGQAHRMGLTPVRLPEMIQWPWLPGIQPTQTGQDGVPTNADDGYLRTYVLLQMTAGGVLVGQGRCRATGFVPDADRELAEGLALADLAAKLRRYMAGDWRTSVPELAQVRRETKGKGWIRSWALLDDVPDNWSMT
jgi:Protein of unknown function (DUF2726)